MLYNLETGLLLHQKQAEIEQAANQAWKWTYARALESKREEGASITPAAKPSAVCCTACCCC